MLIFDRFADLETAKAFAKHIENGFGREAIVCANQEEADQYDIFPFELTPPIALVQRDHDADDGMKMEQHIAGSAKDFGGHFAGT